ncbi:hypothetical protein SAMN04488105_13013 [Salipiger thiooxidans]|uniref:Uncharacterized protein n=1 Tax=Salipiger thiooxidans TaxID=282683 RepID=A0A1G7M6C7_9RHOB|nr:hypothetical protein [Salipiger thiooxidans]SDF57261.1 hypothetical protein SAMN04488105_13013 [Salipiger thiooxidans]
MKHCIIASHRTLARARRRGLLGAGFVLGLAWAALPAGADNCIYPCEAGAFAEEAPCALCEAYGRESDRRLLDPAEQRAIANCVSLTYFGVEANPDDIRSMGDELSEAQWSYEDPQAGISPQYRHKVDLMFRKMYGADAASTYAALGPPFKLHRICRVLFVDYADACRSVLGADALECN